MEEIYYCFQNKTSVTISEFMDTKIIIEASPPTPDGRMVSVSHKQVNPRLKKRAKQ
jgi:hypothetical protein